VETGTHGSKVAAGGKDIYKRDKQCCNKARGIFVNVEDTGRPKPEYRYLWPYR